MNPVLNHPLYHLLLTQLTDKPDLSIIQNRQPLVEQWPLILSAIQFNRTAVPHFIVSDGQQTAICITRVPDVQRRISQMELGSIIHIVGAETKYSDEHKSYVVEIQEICSLKEYDDQVKAQEKAKQDRLNRLKEQQEREEKRWAELSALPSEEKTTEAQPEAVLV